MKQTPKTGPERDKLQAEIYDLLSELISKQTETNNKLQDIANNTGK
jgi:hypothetical protein